MTTDELCAKLRELDPSGKRLCVVDSHNPEQALHTVPVLFTVYKINENRFAKFDDKAGPPIEAIAL